MCRLGILPPALAFLLFTSAAARAQDTPRALIERAIKAHGGEEKLRRLRADKVKVKGVLVVGSREAPFTGETSVQLPSQFKNVLQITVDNRTFSLVQVLNGEQAHIVVDGQPQKLEPAALAEMRETLHLDRAIRLVPLLTDRLFDLTVLPETKVQGKPVQGIRVTAKGRKELRMYFDRATSLLVKTEHHVGDKTGKEVRQEEYYSNFRELGGYLRPVKVVAFRAGTKVMEAVVTEVKYYERMDDAEFAKP
jgi:hypothetical protein